MPPDDVSDFPPNLEGLEARLAEQLDGDVFAFITGGADDGKTLHANRAAFDRFHIRARRLIDVSHIDTRLEILGASLDGPILLAPVGFQGLFHPDGESATARAAAARNGLMVASTVTSHPIETIAAAAPGSVWFQLYPTPDRGITAALVQRADEAGCPVIVVTVDVPVLGNRETQDAFLDRVFDDPERYMGNFSGIGFPEEGLADPTLTWDIIDWLRARTKMKVVIKGIVTHEDAALCVRHGADAIIVSNHGGRQEESGRGAIACLPEVVDAVNGQVPVLVDGGIRRGTDVFKALALGASGVLIGRPYVWGLGLAGQEGVERVIDILRGELVRIMQLAGTGSIGDISSSHLTPMGGDAARL